VKFAPVRSSGPTPAVFRDIRAERAHLDFEPQSREGRKGLYFFHDRGSQSGKEPCPAGQAIGIEDCRLKIEKQRKY